MKDEHRIFLAFLISILILVWFSGRMPQRERQEPTSARPQEPVPEEQVAKRVAVGRGQVSSERVAVWVLRDDAQVSTVTLNAAGAVEEWNMRRYLRPGEDAFWISKGSGVFTDWALSEDPAQVSYRLAAADTREAVFVRQAGPGLRVTKRFVRGEGEYRLVCEMEFVNDGKEVWNLPGFCVAVGAVPLPVTRRDDEHHLEVVCAANGAIRTTSPERFAQASEPQICGSAPWIAARSRYTLVFVESSDASSRPFSFRSDAEAVYGLRTDVKVEPGGRQKVVFTCYGGPADITVAGAHVRREVFGSGPFATAGRIVFSVLAALHRVVPNWGVAIILLTLLVKALFFPLTYGGLRSMKQLQMLRPYLKDIQTKYKDNPTQMQQELMKLYRDYKINPLGGCLPMLVQMPVFIGFFLALRGSIDLRGAPFVLWIRDLSMPDTIWRLPAALPVAGGFPINLLPLLMTATSFIQQKLTPQQDPSQKMMMVMMPVMFLFLFYNFSSGLLLYWVTMNIAGIVEQWAVGRMPQKKLGRRSAR